MKKFFALLLAACLLLVSASAEITAEDREGWTTFLLICNEGMQNDGGNAGNTLMLVSMKPATGKIRLASVTWDTFVDYEGYEEPQRLDQPYRNLGPEEAVRVFDSNFHVGVDEFMSLNYLNLAGLIDEYDGVTVNVTRAERNALNGLVDSKKQSLEAQMNAGLLSQMLVELLAKDYYLNDYGPETKLNGLQAVGFGWLQYDSVYNCCRRDLAVVSSLFSSVNSFLNDVVCFCTTESGVPESDPRRIVNLDALTEDDMVFLRQLVSPIFNKAFHNLTDDKIDAIALSLVRAEYLAARQGQDIYASIETTIFPLEALKPYDHVAGVSGHLVDAEENSAAMLEFLFSDR